MDRTSSKTERLALPIFEDQPLTRAEYISAMTHFYRAEMDRATTWRVRLDTTTNWSIISVMALVSYSMSDHEHSHLGLVVGMVMVLTFLIIEARRFRFFDVWRARVRMLEQNFIAPLLIRNQISPLPDWSKKVADDLLRPRFKLTWHQALRARLVRNYIPMFGLLLACWLIKVESLYHPFEAGGVSQLMHRPLDRSQVSLWGALLVVVTLHAYLLAIVCLVKSTASLHQESWSVDLQELRELDR